MTLLRLLWKPLAYLERKGSFGSSDSLFLATMILAVTYFLTFGIAAIVLLTYISSTVPWLLVLIPITVIVWALYVVIKEEVLCGKKAP